MEKTIVIGSTYPVLGPINNFIASYFIDGSLDTSFGENGVIFTSGEFQGTYRKVAFQDDTHFLISNNQSILRFLLDGTEDTGFGTNGLITPFNVINEELDGFYITDDLSIIVLGTSFTNNQLSHFILKKYLIDGTIDTSFGEDGSMYYPIETSQGFIQRHIGTTTDNRIVIGYSTTINGIDRNIVARFLANGAVDTTFGDNGTVILPAEEGYTCVPITLPNGAIIAGCSALGTDLTTLIYQTVKLSSDGTLDTSFANDGYLDEESAVIVQPNGRFITSNHFTDFEGGIMIRHKRYFPDGSLDASFNFSTNHTELESYEVILTKNGKLLSAANDIWYNGPEINLVLQQHNNENSLGIDQITNQPFRISPNPSSGIYYIDSTQPDFMEFPYEVFDSSGKKIEQGNFNNTNNSINLKRVQNGLYFVKIDNTVIKIVKS